MFHKNAFHRSFLLVLVIFIGGSNLCLAGNICSDQYSQDMDEDHITNQLNHVQDYISSDSLEQALILLESAKKFIDDGDPLMVNWYYYSGHIYQKQNKKSEALGMLKKSYNKAVQINLSDSVLFANINSKLGKAYLDLSDSKNAFNHHFISLKIWKSDTARFHRDLIKNYNLIAEVYDMLYKLDSAKIYLDSAITIMSNYGINSNKITTSLYTNLIINFLKTGKRDTAVYYINENISICRKYTHDKDTEAHMYMLLGLVYSFEGDYEKSIVYFKKDLSITDSIYGKYHLLSAGTLGNLGNQYAYLSDLDSALKCYQDALNIRIREFPEDDPRIANSMMNIGNLYWDGVQFRKALEYYKKAARIYYNKFGPEHHLLERAYSNIGSAYSNLRDFEKALEYYNKSLNINYSSTTLLNLGIVYANLKEFDTAIYCVNRAIREREESDVNPIKVGSGYQKLGLVYKKMKDTLNQFISCRKSTDMYRNLTGKHHIEIARNYDDMGDTYFSLELYDKALENYHNGLIAIAVGFDSRDIYSIPNKNNYRILNELTFLSLLQGKANALLYCNLSEEQNIAELSSAFGIYSECMDIIPQVSREYKNNTTRLKLFENYNSIYINAITAIEKLNREEYIPGFYDSIFIIAEKSKAQLLYESIRESIALGSAGIDKELLIVEKKLGQQINLKQSEIHKLVQAQDENDSVEIAKLQDILFGLNRKYEDLKNQLEKEHEAYYNLKYNTGVSSLDDLRDELNVDQAFVEYLLGESSIVSIVVTKNQTELKIAPIDSTFIQSIEVLKRLNQKQNLDQPDWENYLTTSYFLWQKLIKPFASLIENKELIIVPDKEIWYIPFEVLVSHYTPNGNSDPRDIPWLIKTNPLSYANSATLYLYGLRTRIKKQKSDFIAFAPFSSDNEMEEHHLTLLRERGVEDVTLFGATREVNGIEEHFNGSIYFDKMATEKKFWMEANNHDIIHIASHGIIDDQKPSYSMLLFRNEPGDTINDGEVHTFELFNQRLNAQMVVLSACNTGMGEILRGEGVISLARGFLYTGIPGIVMTLWSVDDQASADLMKYFYKNLHDGKAKNIALQQAKLEYLKNVKNPNKIHPRFWAGYVLIGDPDPLNRNNQTKIILIVFSALIVSIAVILILRRKRNKKFS